MSIKEVAIVLVILALGYWLGTKGVLTAVLAKAGVG
jgi:predicted permease